MASDWDPQEEDLVIEAAQAAWSSVASSTRRWTLGKVRLRNPSKAEGRKKTLKTWMDNRRREARRLALVAPKRTMEETRKRARKEGSEAWTDKMAKERDFNDMKRLRTFYQQVIEGTVLPEELSDGDLEIAKELIDEDSKQRAATAAEHAKERARFMKKGPDLTTLVDAKVWVNPTVRKDELDNVNSSIKKYCMENVASRMDAQVFIVGDITNPGSRNTLAASIKGGLIVGPSYINSGGLCGVGLRYKPVTRTKRLVFISPDFNTHHTDLADLLDVAVRARGSKWRHVPCAADFLEWSGCAHLGQSDSIGCTRRLRP